MVTCGYIAEGYEYPMLKFTVISESDIFGKKKKKKKRKTYEGKKIQEFADLLAELGHIVIDGLCGHHLSHIALARRIRCLCPSLIASKLFSAYSVAWTISSASCVFFSSSRVNIPSRPV